MTRTFKLIVLFSFLMIPCFQGFGQASEEKAIDELINHLFKSMAKGDSASLHTAFIKGATLVSVYRDKNNEPVIKRDESIQPWLKAIGTPHPEPYYEEIWNMKILVDGDFASAWCDYALYVGNKFSHCGVDAFHLHKSKEGWKIFHLADTRRKTGCTIPKMIEDKHK
jgi:hypothetical protein